MDTTLLELYIKLSLLLLFLVLWFIFSIIVLRQKITYRQKLFVVLTFLPFAFIGLSLLATILIHQYFLVIAFLGIFPLFFMLGVTQLYFAKDAEGLYEFLRNKGGLWRWLVPSLPKKENYLMKGIFLIVIGGVFTLFLILSFLLR